MSQFQENPYQAPAMTPPVHGGDIPTGPKTWPTVIGVIMIIVASLGLLQNVCGGIVGVLMPALIQSMPAEAADDPSFKAQIEIGKRFLPFQIANAVVLLALGVLLLMAGIATVKRKRVAVKYSRVWAVARILWAFPAAVATYFIMVETIKTMEQAAADAGQPMPSGIMTFMQMLGPLGAVINLIFWCALPVFVLIWFARGAIKDETAKWL